MPTLVAGLTIPGFGLQNVVFGYSTLVVLLAIVAVLLLLCSRSKRRRETRAAWSAIV